MVVRDDMGDIEARPNSHQRNRLQMNVDDYARFPQRWLDAERFLAIRNGPDGVAHYTYVRGRRRDYWAHASMKSLQFEIK